MTTFEAFSAIPGELRYADIAAQVGDVDAVAVHALTGTGMPVVIQLNLVELWGGPGRWRRALACPLCGCPVRVLTVALHGAGCASCIPRRTRHQLRKTAKAWVEEQDIDKLIRQALRGGGVSGDFIALARTLRQRATQRLQCTLDFARLAIFTAARSEEVFAGSSIEVSGSSSDEGHELELHFELPIGTAPSEEWSRRRGIGVHDS